MEAGTFKDLIVEAYKKSKEDNLVGILYGAISTCGFSDIADIEELLEIGNPDVPHLRSKLTDMEADIYKWELEDYKVKTSERTIYVKLEGKPEQPSMYQRLILYPYLNQAQDRNGASECMKGNITGKYKVKNSKGEYFVSWVEKVPVFNRNSMFGERFSETGVLNPIKLPSEENTRGRESVPVSVPGI